MAAPMVAALPRAGQRWTPYQLAEALVPHRDRLVARLPREIAAARDLTRDQCELVVDEALDFIVTEYARPIVDGEMLERVFWSAASIRVKRAHEGRCATVRGGWQRIDVDALQLAAHDEDPEAIAVANLHRALVLEFAAGLDHRERLVLACKYGGPGRLLGRRLISRRLEMPTGEVRTHERAIARKLARFVRVVAAGTLCEHRAHALIAFVLGSATREQAGLARVHLVHCARCRHEVAERLRVARA